MEWDYGDYEGLTTHEIRTETPGWLLWTYGCPGGENVDQVSMRADQAVAYALDPCPTAMWCSSATALRSRR